MDIPFRLKIVLKDTVQQTTRHDIKSLFIYIYIVRSIQSKQVQIRFQNVSIFGFCFVNLKRKSI